MTDSTLTNEELAAEARRVFECEHSWSEWSPYLNRQKRQCSKCKVHEVR